MTNEHVTVEADSVSFSRRFNPAAQARLKAPPKSEAKEYQNYARPWPATTQLRLMDLNLFRVFDAMMLHRSVRKASQTLSVTPSAVSHALGRLCQSIGDELFIPTESGMQPTRRALELASAVREGLEKLESALTGKESVPADPRTFPIGATDYERKEDIQPLVSYFVDRYAKRAGRKIRGIRKSALDSLQSYSWPGNIRELQNVIERSLIVCETDEFTIDQSWLSGGPAPTRSADQALIETSAPGERELIEAALAQTKGKVSGLSGAAAKLGIPASTLESKIRSLKINKYRFKEH